jgi:hypothetical protein
MVLRAELLSNWDWENATAAAEVASSREELADWWGIGRETYSDSRYFRFRTR